MDNYEKRGKNICTKALLLHNNLCELPALEHKFKTWFCTKKIDISIYYSKTFVLKISSIQKKIRLRFDKTNSITKR